MEIARARRISGIYRFIFISFICKNFRVPYFERGILEWRDRKEAAFRYHRLTLGLFITGNRNVSGKENNAYMRLVTCGS